jgi:hypothetical protein
MIGHLQREDRTQPTPSPLLDELTAADVEAISGGMSTGFEPWLGLMAAAGPWPAAVPELERMLDGNRKGEAAIVLSHLQHPRALEILVTEGFGVPHPPQLRARAVGRHGIDGVVALARAIAAAEADSDRLPPGRTAALSILTELAIGEPELVRLASEQEPVAAALTRVRDAFEEALARGDWPSTEAILLLDSVDGDVDAVDGDVDAVDEDVDAVDEDLDAVDEDLDALDDPATDDARRRVTMDSALGRTLAAAGRLSRDSRSVRRLLFANGSGGRVLLQRLASIVRDADHPLRDAVLGMMRAPAEEGYQAARWILREAEKGG